MNKSEWLDQAYYAAVKALRYTNKPFLAEELYQKVLKYVDEPVDARVMGALVTALKKNGEIFKVGYSNAKSSNHGVKVLWSRASHGPLKNNRKQSM